MYAVIETGGKQYKVSENDLIKVERLSGEVGDEVVFDRVLMISGEGKPKVGKPFIKGARVTASITAQDRDRKVTVYKYKRKSGYHKKNGHRQYFTEVRIGGIAAKAKD